MNIKPKRPILRYHGGKWRLAPWVLSYFPPHRVYVEPYGGAASVLMLKKRSYAEIYNELDTEVVNVFRVLRDISMAYELEIKLRMTPFSRVEFEAAYEPSDDPIEQARRTIVKAFAGFGSNAIHCGKARGMRTRASTWKSPTGFRSNSTRSGTTPAHDWKNYPTQISAFCDRLQGVVIENATAIDVMNTHDKPDALHYVDPPYTKSSRADTSDDYSFEMTDNEHRELGKSLHALRGMVVLSGYPSDLYDIELFPKWYRVERKHLADGALKRTEVLWLNPAAEAAMRNVQVKLF